MNLNAPGSLQAVQLVRQGRLASSLASRSLAAGRRGHKSSGMVEVPCPEGHSRLFELREYNPEMECNVNLKHREAFYVASICMYVVTFTFCVAMLYTG